MAHQVFTCKICGQAVKAHGNMQNMFFYHHYRLEHPAELVKAKKAYQEFQKVMSEVGLSGNLDEMFLSIRT